MQQSTSVNRSSCIRDTLLALLGLAAGGCFLFAGTTGRTSLWIPAGAYAFVLVALLVGHRIFPRGAVWFKRGLIFLLAAGVGIALAVGATFALMFAQFDTEYAPGYSEAAFKRIAIGDSQDHVLALLGDPLSTHDTEPYTSWVYSPDGQPRFADTGRPDGTFTLITFGTDGRVKNIWGQRVTGPRTFTMGPGINSLNLTPDAIERLIGAAPEAMREAFGEPTATYVYKASRILRYSRSPSSTHYHLRTLGLDKDGRVVHVWRSIYWD